MGSIDHAVFAELRETTGSEFVSELVQTFLDDAPQLLATLRASLAAHDAQAFRRAAHTLKANSNTFGATRLASMAKELESGGLAAAAGLDPLEREFASVAQELGALRNG